jgi:hypothetical protein
VLVKAMVHSSAQRTAATKALWSAMAMVQHWEQRMVDGSGWKLATSKAAVWDSQ